MKKIIKSIIPSIVISKVLQAKRKIQLRRNMMLDYKHYKKYAFFFTDNKTKRHLEADLIFYYHKIEKGLALPKPRIGFGKKHIAYLLNALETYISLYGWDDISLISLDTLESYYTFNEKNGLNLSDLNEKIINFKQGINKSKNTNQIGGVKTILKKNIINSNIDFKGFAETRYSIRTFSKEKVEDILIKKAVQIAQKTPSVCNRQSAKVYSFNQLERKKSVLKYQNGNAGFGETASHILIVTEELKDYRGTIERNQSYIDGGMYAMSLIYALHSLGLGTCPLNLSIEYETATKLKKEAGISDSEIPIMMIAIGHIPEQLDVAASPRRDISEVLTYKD